MPIEFRERGIAFKIMGFGLPDPQKCEPYDYHTVLISSDYRGWVTRLCDALEPFKAI